MRSELLKWMATIKIAIVNQLAYKLNFVLFIIGPSLVYFLIKVNLWKAIFATPDLAIEGYTVSTMLSYQGWVLIVSLLAQSFNSMNLAEDIRLGRISSYLVYPYDFWRYHAARFLGGLVIQLFVTGLTAGALVYGGIVTITAWDSFILGILTCLIVAQIWFVICFIIGIMAFWLEETWVFRVMFLTLAQFFSGALIPIELFPQWMTQFLLYTPFPYLTYLTAKVFTGDAPISILQAWGALAIWFLLLCLFARWLWGRGIRLYTAAGM